MSDAVYSVGPDDPIRCDNCGVNMLRPCGNGSELDNTLSVSLFGGYGQFIDDLEEKMDAARKVMGDDYNWIPIDSEMNGSQKLEWAMLCVRSNQIIVCHECAHRLCEQFPAFNNKIKPYDSHTHTQQYVDNHPNHYGYDYDFHWNKEKA